MKRSFVLIAWAIILSALAYAYFFHNEFFHQLFEYSGPGSPYVNTPRG